MPWLDWFRPPRNLLTFYLAGTLAAAAALAWLGWRLLDQERVLEGTRAQERLEISADRVVALLQRSLDDLERQSAAAGATVAEDTVVVTADRRTVQARPPDRLVFYPFLAEPAEGPGDVFRAGEAAEFAGGDLANTIAIYRGLTGTRALPVRAGALVRLGRSLRKAGRHDEALQVYLELARLPTTFIEGLPAELVAREARCSVLQERGSRDALEREARDLYHDLARGRWPLRRAAWDFLMDETRAWAGSSAPPVPGLEAATALSEAAESLWTRWPDLPPAGQAVSLHGGRPVLAVWTATPERLVGVLAGSGYLEAMCRQAAGEARVQLCLSDRDGHIILGKAAGPQATRAAAATRLPWNLQVSSANPAGEIALAGTRRRTLLAGLALLAVLILASGYFTFRGIQRELTVARQQSEFVSAVSHEFRTPLTSMRQLSEMLSRGRVISEDRRQQYYDVLTRESERLHRVVEGLLNFGRMEAGVTRWRLEPVDLGEIVRSVADEFQRQAEACHVEVSIDAAPCRIRAERDMLSLAVWNLLDNAMKYSPGCPTIWISLSRDGSRAAIAVRDQGVGIPRQEQRRIFQKFVRGTGTLALGVKGSGIGLVIVDHVVKAHGGRVRLESDVGRGSTFTLLLPLEVTQ
jgi:signal transduction histidine kinase